MDETLTTFLSLFIMIFSFGFFLVAILFVTRDHRESWERRMMEAREFGAPLEYKQNVKEDTPKSQP
jgi:hypothetical protein